MENTILSRPPRIPFDWKKFLPSRIVLVSLVSGLIVCGGSLLAVWMVNPPRTFPVGIRIGIPQGTSLAGSAKILAEKHVVRSSLLLQFLLIAQSGTNGVKAGTYQFDQPLSTLVVAHALLAGSHGVPLIRITIPEGLRNAQIDALVSAQLSTITPGAFERATAGKEGYLFPDTYYVPETFTAEQFVTLMEDTFKQKIMGLATPSDSPTRSVPDIITMASILEREGNNEESMRRIAGILWKRLDHDMPLQVDASFSYLFNKASSKVTVDDLKTDSPYNTYKYKGLPPTPLNNPGLTALTAALSPTESPFLYYLTAPDGTFHYARTYQEHKKNATRYLD